MVIQKSDFIEKDKVKVTSKYLIVDINLIWF